MRNWSRARKKTAVLAALVDMPFYMENNHEKDPAVTAAIEKALLAELKDSDPNNRVMAVNGLRGVRDPGTRGLLLQVERTDPSAAVRAKAAEALSEIRPFPGYSGP
ncbi:MAG TPA: HEAT repeat domain-containing protein [Terriglobales bacterium]